jgi:hypothetical protein
LYPKTVVGKRARVPDFRVKRGVEPWVHVEVTRPDVSEVAERAQATVTMLAGVVQNITKPIAIEVFLRREPTGAEMEGLGRSILAFSAKDEARREELPEELGLLISSVHPPGMVVLADHPGEQMCPRFGAAKLVGGVGEPARQVIVRMPFSDQRAERFIASEAAQLPGDTPGLIMIDISKTRSGFKSWEPLIKRRFQPTIHTRVGGVCLFSAENLPTPTGLLSLFETKLLLNPHATIPLPGWIGATIGAAAVEYKRVIKQDAEKTVK